MSGQPVLPVLLRYQAKHLNLGWGIVYTPWHFFRMCTQFVNHLEVDILAPYVPSEGASAKLVSTSAGNHERPPNIDSLQRSAKVRLCTLIM